MRFSSKGLCAAILGLTAGSAAAQSSVTLYGVADTFFQFLANGGQQSWSLRSGGNSASLLGFKGSEDLGGGLKAVFTLEGGFNVNNGTSQVDSSAMFYRQAWVALTHEKYGSLQVGRQYQPTFWLLYPSDPFRANEALSPLAAASTTVDRNTLATQTAGGRSSNAIVYKTQNMGGVELRGMYALAASVAQPYPLTTGNMLDIAASYTGHGLYAGVAYQNQHPGSKTMPGLPATLPTLGTEHFTGALAYRVGPVNFQFNYAYHRPKDTPAGSLAARLNAGHPFSTMEAGATIQATPADTIEIAAMQRVARGVHDNAWLVQAGFDHSISKRTGFYGRAGFLKNNGTSTAGWPGISPNGLNATETLVAAGMTHRF
ncbi:porin [Caballeronia sp. LZ001]|uniref:porin n=1 Tax=Caballeronia sp. LZ001 TaxID=3038553 RepID=UPI00286258CF|nr:porin [Caballeronia sp. LZ001]MDR5799411.1 porin [Caballeronia sp. LZ001]